MKVIIVGGGISGLYSGIHILKKGYDVTILEKNNYIGGRTTTYKKDGVQWEIGAGRLHESHTLLNNLIRKYKLSLYPIDDSMLYYNGRELVPNTFNKFIELLEPLKNLPASMLENNTLSDLTDVLGLRWIWSQYPYNAEVTTLRADLGLDAFLNGEMKNNKHFYGIREGFGELIKRMVSEFEESGGKIKKGCAVTEYMGDGKIRVKTDNGGEKIMKADKIIFATHALGLRDIDGIKHMPALNYVRMRPLIRIYAKFPIDSNGKPWFVGIPKVITNTLIKYFIPINYTNGTAMISYTDADYADDLLPMIDNGKKEEVKRLIMADLRSIFPSCDKPEFIKIYGWSEGSTYWLPGEYSPSLVSEQVMNPLANVYICGESFSLRQAWVEGALEHTSSMLEKYF